MWILNINPKKAKENSGENRQEAEQTYHTTQEQTQDSDKLNSEDTGLFIQLTANETQVGLRKGGKQTKSGSKTQQTHQGSNYKIKQEVAKTQAK